MEQTEKQTPKYPTPEELEAMMVIPAFLVTFGVLLLQVLIYGLPVVAILLPFLYSPGLWFTIVWALCTPVVYAFLYGVVAGLLSRPFQMGIIKGVFPRDVRFPVYALRKLYGICWSSVYYFKPVYSIILSVPFIKIITFRLFGYKGSLNIALYPDAWIRDLTLLKIDDGVYIANRATLGTNICTLDGYVRTGNITLMKNSMIGHRATVGLGLRLGERSEIGVECALGIHIKIGNGTIIGAASGISHGAKIGNNTNIGLRTFIGLGAVIGDNLNIPSNTQIPDKAEVHTMEDVMKYVRTNSPTIH